MFGAKARRIRELEQHVSRLIELIVPKPKATKPPRGALRSVSRSPSARLKRAKSKEEKTLREAGVDVD